VTPVDNRHLAEGRLMASFLSEGDGPGLAAADPEAFAHLRTCELCARRYEQVGWQVEALREADRDDCDALFTSEHLEAQRGQILRRLEHLGRQARVLKFPAAAVRHLSRPHRSHSGARWVAAAAVAGLAIGMSLGWFLDLRPTRFLPTNRVASVTAPVNRTARGAQQGPLRVSDTAPFDDEAFLSRIDRAYATQRAAELEALDALTPRVREVALVIR
jgi:hypothetical protein